MQSGSKRDVLGGLVLLALGGWAAWHAHQGYNLGTLRNMGPGMFPMAIGVLLAVLGAAIAVPAAVRSGPRVTVDLRAAVCVMAGVASFALIVPHLGLMPAIVSTVAISSLAASRYRVLSVVLLSAGLCGAAWLVFRIGLGLPLTMFRSPF